jgi:peptide/nickel transport system substrate-binding protein
MRLIGSFIAILRAYNYRDKLFSGFAIAIILLMFVKMIFFPYGLFNFGEPNIYTEGLVSELGIQNINPLFVDYNSADREISSLVFSGLMKYDPERKAIVDDMAKLAINEEKTEYTLILREGLQWHDGQPVTADDVYFTFNDMIKGDGFGNEILKTNFSGIDIVQIDEKTVKFLLQKPNSFFIANLTIGILPKHLLEGVAAHEILQDDFNKKPVGTGPYMVTAPATSVKDKRMQITVERSPYYYGQASEIEKIRFFVFPTMETLVEELSSVNGVVKVTGNYIIDFKNNDRFELFPYELPQYMAVFMNMESNILKDSLKVRLALQKAIDKEELLAKFVDKIPVDTPLMQLNQEDWRYQSSKDQAQGALKDSGYNYSLDDLEKEGVRYDGEGNALELNLIARLYNESTDQFQELLEIVEFLQDSWEEVGFQIRIELLEDEVFKQRVMSRQYDLLFVGQSLGYNLDTYSYWHSTQADPRGQNFSNYKSFQVDSLIEDVRSIFDQARMEEDLNKLAEQLKKDVPAVFLYRPIYYYASDSKVSGISMDGVVFPSDRFCRVGEWKFE